ncbi:Terpene synthase, N-terminal domain [Dillenia turbinata]|uniref:Terpene synthase, N-terminal domain n=1 Tax=Dillenia turbinata TaxID=194707 RepID=A0AAN8UXG3_9MAGN
MSSNMTISKERRSANYHPSIWDPEIIDRFTTSYTYEIYGNQFEDLKENARRLLTSTKDSSTRSKLVDLMQRLGVAYHFEEEIKEAISPSCLHIEDDHDLYTTALHFRLLRERGHFVSTDVFDKFKKDGKFMERLNRDVKGLLSLYEASYLMTVGEDDLEEAQYFSFKHLKSSMEDTEESLDIPLHWRLPRLEARNFIDVYRRDPMNNPLLLDLARLDFNLVQSQLQEELKELARWWKALNFKDTLSFARDRLMENYLWALGITFEPKFSQCRIVLTKFVCILSAIDDLYDVYGSINELEKFTDAVSRWDTKAMDGLPECMKICLSTMIDFADELANLIQSKNDFNALPYLKEAWLNLCKSYLVEARWFSMGYTPKLSEYLENAWTSVGGPAAMAHAYLAMGCTIDKSTLNCLRHGSKLLYWSSRITRLSDDLGTSQAEIERGDVAKSIHCYMKEKGASEDEARDYIKNLIAYSWKKMNEDIIDSKSLPKPLVNMILNMARTAQCIFQYGDGIGTSGGVTKDRLISLVVKPISISTHS